MKDELKLKVKNLIEQEGLIEKGDRVVLGLSGGPDSICLLDLLFDLQKTFDFTLSALHVNHMIRGTEADADEKFLTEYCRGRGIEFSCVKIDVPSLAKESGRTEEETGRDIRIEALKKTGANKIALAHNLNDQAETVLMRILRGTGVSGLCAMETKRADGIIRPLLTTTREEIEEYVALHNLPARIDKTNLQADYTRNKIRLELLPALKAFNPNIIEALARLSDSARQDDLVLNGMATAALRDAALRSDNTALRSAVNSTATAASSSDNTVLGSAANSTTTAAHRSAVGSKEKTRKSENPISLKSSELVKLPDAVLSRVIVLWLEDAGLTEDISAVHINALIAAIRKNVGNKTIEFPHGYKIYLNSGQLTILVPR